MCWNHLNFVLFFRNSRSKNSPKIYFVFNMFINMYTHEKWNVKQMQRSLKNFCHRHGLKKEIRLSANLKILLKDKNCGQQFNCFSFGNCLSTRYSFVISRFILIFEYINDCILLSKLQSLNPSQSIRFYWRKIFIASVVK